MAYIVITEEEKSILVTNYVKAHEAELASKFREIIDSYDGSRITPWKVTIALEALDTDDDDMIIEPEIIADEAYDGYDNMVVKPLGFECECYQRGKGYIEHVDLVGMDEWSEADIQSFIKSYIPGFSFSNREYVDRESDFCYEEDFEDESDDSPYDCWFCPLEDEDVPLEERPCSRECEYFIEHHNDELSSWPGDSFSDHFDSEADERHFWESSI